SVGSLSAGGYLVSSPEILAAGVPNSSNDFLRLCTVIPTGAATGQQQIGRFASLPTVTVLANETSTASEVSPTASRSSIGATNHGSYTEHSRQWALQSEKGAQAIARLHANAQRTHLQVQIVEGTGSSGQVLGLSADSSITNTSGASLTWATCCTTMA